jgi:hypothetical protein
MATLRQSAAVNMQGWQAVQQNTQAKSAPAGKPSPVDTRTQRNPNMLSPMPAIATLSDGLSRQFYGGLNVPTYRILPAKGGSTQ